MDRDKLAALASIVGWFMVLSGMAVLTMSTLWAAVTVLLLLLAFGPMTVGIIRKD